MCNRVVSGIEGEILDYWIKMSKHRLDKERGLWRD